MKKQSAKQPVRKQITPSASLSRKPPQGVLTELANIGSSLACNQKNPVDHDLSTNYKKCLYCASSAQ